MQPEGEASNAFRKGGRLHIHGAEHVGESEQYGDSYRLCYVRGPEGKVVALAEQLS